MRRERRQAAAARRQLDERGAELLGEVDGGVGVKGLGFRLGLSFCLVGCGRGRGRRLGGSEDDVGLPVLLWHGGEARHVDEVALEHFRGAGWGGWGQVVYHDGDAGDGAGEQFGAHGGDGVGDPGAEGRMARLKDGRVVEAGGEEGGARVEVAEGEEGVDVGG